MNPTELALRIITGDVQPKVEHLSVFAPNEPRQAVSGNGFMNLRIRDLATKRVRDLAFRHVAAKLDNSALVELARMVDNLNENHLELGAGMMAQMKTLATAGLAARGIRP